MLPSIHALTSRKEINCDGPMRCAMVLPHQALPQALSVRGSTSIQREKVPSVMFLPTNRRFKRLSTLNRTYSLLNNHSVIYPVIIFTGAKASILQHATIYACLKTWDVFYARTPANLLSPHHHARLYPALALQNATALRTKHLALATLSVFQGQMPERVL